MSISIERRVIIGKLAKSVVRDVMESISDLGCSEEQALYLKKVYENLGVGSLTTNPDPHPMTDKGSKEFGSELMTFGKFKGERIDSVPLEYLAWYHDTSLNFTCQIGRYLSSQRIKQEA